MSFDTNPKPAWKLREEARMLEQYDDAVVRCGVPYWKSNDRIPFDDMVQVWVAAGKPINVALTNGARKTQEQASIQAYRVAQANRSPEQMAEERLEARAAHGPGVTLVDVFTGRRFTT